MKKLLLSACIMLGIVTACSSDDDANNQPCTDVYTPGLKVTVMDGGIALTEGVTVTAVESEYAEVLENVSSTPYFQGAFERPGTYIITVMADGYEPYASEPVTVEEDECHVITREITVNLVPAEE